MGKYLRPQKCAFSDIFGPDLRRHVVAFCMGIAICHRRKFGQVWGSQAPYRRKTSRPDSTPFDLRLPQGKIVIILRCNPWGAGGHWKVRFRCFVWENRPKSENWASLTPRSSATVRRTKTLTWTRKLPGPWTTTWSKHYRSAVHPVTCSLLWVRYLFDIFLLSDFWGKWPLKWKFSKMSCISWFIDGTPKYVSWPNLVKSAVVKLPKGRMVYQSKKLGLRRTRPSPHFRQNGPIALKIPWTLSPLDLSTNTEFGPDRLRFAGLIPERLIFRPKKSIQYRLSAYN